MEPKGLLPHSQAFPILSLINPIHACPSQFLNIHFNIFLPPMPRSSKYSLSLRSVYQHTACTSPVSHACHMPHPSHSSIQNTAQFKQLSVSVELQHCDVTARSLIESCWGCGGTCGLHCQVKIHVFNNKSRQNTVSHIQFKFWTLCYYWRTPRHGLYWP